jgi:hypothetical protein
MRLAGSSQRIGRGSSQRAVTVDALPEKVLSVYSPLQSGAQSACRAVPMW